MILLLTNSTKHTRLVSGVLRVSEPQGSLVFPVKLFLPLLEGRKADLPLASFSCWTPPPPPPPWSYYHYLTKTGGHFRRSNEKLNSHMSNIHGKGPIADCNNKHCSPSAPSIPTFGLGGIASLTLSTPTCRS